MTSNDKRRIFDEIYEHIPDDIAKMYRRGFYDAECVIDAIKMDILVNKAEYDEKILAALASV